MIKKMMMLQVLLVLCVGGSIAEDLLSPTVNIIAELEKIKHMEERMKTLEETVNKVMSENEALKGLVQDSQNKVESLQKFNEAKKVAFSVGLLESGTGQTGPFNAGKTLTYKKIFSNIGNAYDSNTGVFTAPVKGAYFFRFYAHCHGGIKMAVSLYKNGQLQCSVYSHKPITNGNASNGVVLMLENGDRVHTQLWGSTWVYDDPAGYTSFSGFLIFPL